MIIPDVITSTKIVEIKRDLEHHDILGKFFFILFSYFSYDKLFCPVKLFIISLLQKSTESRLGDGFLQKG